MLIHEDTSKGRLTPEELFAAGRVAFNPTEVADILGVDPRTVRRACQDGQLPSFTVGKLILIPKDGLMRLLHGNSTEVAE